MRSWPDGRLLKLFGIEVPILLAPMAGSGTPRLAIEVGLAGGLGALACSQLSVAQVREALRAIREAGALPINLNFFCHVPPTPDPVRERQWLSLLAPYYRECGIDPATEVKSAARLPFDGEYCALIEAFRPEVVSFHFGLPEQALLERVRASGARIVSSATTVAEARWLEDHGCDAIIAMGLEAGGHRGNFLSTDMSRQVGTFALVPQIVDAVGVPVIAAGGIADARGIVAALALGAAGVQMGTAYLFCPEANVSALHRRALRDAQDDGTALTNLFTGRPARGIVNRLMDELGPLSDSVPSFPLAATGLLPLRQRAEANGSPDFTNLWSGQSARLCREMPAGDLTRSLAREALLRLERP